MVGGSAKFSLFARRRCACELAEGARVRARTRARARDRIVSAHVEHLRRRRRSLFSSNAAAARQRARAYQPTSRSLALKTAGCCKKSAGCL